MKVKFIRVPGNYKGDGIWEGEVSAEDTDCDQLQVKLCQHEEAYFYDNDIWRCAQCRAEKINGIWKKR